MNPEDHVHLNTNVHTWRLTTSTETEYAIEDTEKESIVIGRNQFLDIQEIRKIIITKFVIIYLIFAVQSKKNFM